MSDYQGKGVWCVVEMRRGRLSPTAFELLSAGRKLAAASGETVSAVLLGKGLEAAAQELAGRGADRVLVLDHERLAEFVDDVYAAALKGLAEKEKPARILFIASVLGRSLAPRLAVALRGGLSADATDVGVDSEGNLVVSRSAYAGNVVSQVLVRRQPQMATVRPLVFERSAPSEKKGEIARVEADAGSWPGGVEFVSFAPEQSNEIDLSTAERIVSGGRGLGNAEGFKLIRDLAKELGAAVGASRATVDAGWIPYRHQVGITGRSVRPKLYIACGISGQIQHMAGMKSSDVIVAINTDPECPMMKAATYAVAGDVYKILPALISEIRKGRGN